MTVRRLNHAVLYVRDAEVSSEFYRETLGFEVSAAHPGAVFLKAAGSANDHDLGLFSVGPDAGAPRRGQTGLYHLAWEVGTLGELLSVAERLSERGAIVGASDHIVATSIYAKDPDGIEFEVMWRVPAGDWDREARSRQLDLDAALARWGADLATGAAAGSPT
ncbi:VOC family protein [Longispora albida]|uniref:VOC family protein n=1 Tax=Longispora albida TaxID=203523 RepID=UPI00039CD165|nr:VOC family protein [Longispora albida]